ncbi:TetR/AcrR family transcriptional regulator [Georgenia satyanarayanai]|uniref:TetR/AcrR family transcriptional regulator n=1 Tax=Georgenia satyanarayanai TaxID=860221 RepID=UPI000DA17A6E|nr:TetR/AcrR family transcriptional regulator [Georgenia satyanarayanai]
MAEVGRTGEADRAPLSRERVLDRAIAVADAGGLGSLTMRSLATELGVKPMALYHYVANKNEILDGIVDRVFGEIELPAAGGQWREEVSRRAESARSVLRRHPWAISLMESRSAPGPATLRHHEAMLDTLRGAGFSLAMTGHAYALLDAFVYGFAVQEAALPFDRDAAPEVVAGIAAQLPAEDYPRLHEYAHERVMTPGYDFGDEFTFGLGVVLDALERSLRDGDGEAPAPGTSPAR